MGLLGSIGRAIGGVAGVVGRVVPGPVGAIASVAGRVLTSSRPAAGGTINLPAPPPIPSPFGAMPWPGTPGNPGVMLATPTSPAPYNPPFTMPAGGGIMSPLGTMAKVPSGYHINRTLVRASVMQQNRGGITPGMQRAVSQVVRAVVKNQHMNPLNPRALRRADRRARGFLRFARKVVKHYQAKAPKGKAYIKAGRKR